MGIWDALNLRDGGFMLAPRWDLFNLDGEWGVENMEVAPVVEVHMSPWDVIRGQEDGGGGPPNVK